MDIIRHAAEVTACVDFRQGCCICGAGSGGGPVVHKCGNKNVHYLHAIASGSQDTCSVSLPLIL